MTAIAPLRTFVDGMTQLLSEHATEQSLLPACGEILKALILQDNWLPDEFAHASAENYRQYLLYCDSRERFSIVSFVWGPGQTSPIHDHCVWGAIGVLRGQERATSFSRQDGRLVRGATADLLPGEVEYVSPRLGDIHQVSNALDDQPSVSIHVYGANIGRIRRHVFDPVTGERSEFVSGYSNRVVPELL